MADPRIYRGFLVVVAFAVIVFGFSLRSQPHGLTTTIAPGQFFSSAETTIGSLATQFPNRSPGSAGDRRLADYIRQQLSGSGSGGSTIGGFDVQTDAFSADTSDGTRVLENVIATRPGLGGGTIVVVSHRDGLGSPDQSDLSGTAVLLGLARALSGETLNRSVTLVSTSGQIGAAGAARLAQSLAGRQVDAVIVLGDLAGGEVRSPVVVPWSNTDRVAAPLLRTTLGGYVTAQTGISDESSGLAGQFARLAFPFAITEQAPFAADGISSVLLSLSGDRPAMVNEPLGPAGRVAGLGAAVVQTVNALDSGPTVAGPSSYLLLSGKLVPLWAIRLLVLALILPVAATTLDAMARIRRRGHALIRWVGWVLAGVVPFLVGLVALLIARAAGLTSTSPPGAVARSAGTLTGGDVLLLVALVAVVLCGFLFLRPLCLRMLSRLPEAGRRPESPAADAAAVALSVVMSGLSLVVWLLNPFAALLLVPALHLWLWLAQPGVRRRRWAVSLLVLVAVVPGLLILVYYANAYSLSPLGLAWSLTLLPGGALSTAAALYWTVALGCLGSAVIIAMRAVRAAAGAAEPPVTLRGPASYAGPGSLGGTESALRR